MKILKKCKDYVDIKIKFEFDEQLNLILEIIKQFGKITLNDNIFIDSKIINKDKDQQTSIINWIKQKQIKIWLNLKKFLQ